MQQHGKDIIFKKSTFLLGFVLFLTVFFPWELITPGRFEDLVVYKRILNENSRSEEGLFSQPLALLLREIVFQRWMFFLYDLINDVDITITVITAVNLIIFIIACKRLRVNYKVALLLLCPMMIDFFNAQIRNSFALAIFLLAVSIQNKVIRYMLFFVCISIHLGTGLIIASYFLVEALPKVFKNRWMQVLALLIFALICAFGDRIFLRLIGDFRQEVYTGEGGKMSVIYLIWAVIFFLVSLFKRVNLGTYNKYIDYALIASILITMSYFSGAYYGRYLAMFFPLILLGIGKVHFHNGLFWVIGFYAVYTFSMNFII